MAQGIDRVAIANLLRQGLKYADVAEQTGCSYRSVATVAEEIGMSRKQPSHKDAVPWTLDERHKLSMPAQRLRDLSRLSQGLYVDVHRKIGALRWAQQLVDEGLDIAYEPDHEPSWVSPDGGFYAIEATATPGRTHVGKWLKAATGKPVRRTVRQA
ncbi:hypothetical protein GCM10009560_79080 [Nonomuraea longicatena]|uniref:Transposase n=1 Tax=Nonomuraea longicatena TaxID=83682 RepID=A0ABN1RD52_9ACTN